MSIVIQREHAEKLVDVIGHGLCNGVGKPIPGQMCVEAAVCYALGLPHGDDPGCVIPSLRRLKIGLNDRAWSSNQARAHGLKRLALAQLGSLGHVDDAEFRRRVIEMTIRKAVPVGLRAAARVNPTHAEALEAAALRCEREGTREAAQAARTAASAADAYAAAYAADAAYAYAYAYAAADADADDAAYAAADADADDAAYAAADADADDADADADDADADAARTRDRVLGAYAECVVEILIDMQAPGCQWLDLCPVEAV